MVLKWGAAFGCAAAMLAFAWMPVAFIINGEIYDARRPASVLDVQAGRVPVLAASRIDAADFLNARLVPTLDPEPIDLAEPTSARGLLPEASTLRRRNRIRHVPAELSQRPYARLVERAANRHGVDARLVHALIEVESSYRADVVSAAGAMGLMQLMPGTARRYGVNDPLDPEANIDAGTRHLRALLDEFGPLFGLKALAAYHAGEVVVRRHDGIPPYPQTHRFVRRVLEVLLSQTGWGGGD